MQHIYCLSYVNNILTYRGHIVLPAIYCRSLFHFNVVVPHQVRITLHTTMMLTDLLQIPLENREGLYAIHNIFLAVSPSVYRPVDMLLKALFIQQTNLVRCISCQVYLTFCYFYEVMLDFERLEWLCLIVMPLCRVSKSTKS